MTDDQLHKPRVSAYEISRFNQALARIRRQAENALLKAANKGYNHAQFSLPFSTVITPSTLSLYAPELEDLRAYLADQGITLHLAEPEAAIWFKRGIQVSLYPSSTLNRPHDAPLLLGERILQESHEAREKAFEKALRKHARRILQNIRIGAPIPPRIKLPVFETPHVSWVNLLETSKVLQAFSKQLDAYDYRVNIGHSLAFMLFELWHLEISTP